MIAQGPVDIQALTPEQVSDVVSIVVYVGALAFVTIRVVPVVITIVRRLMFRGLRRFLRICLWISGVWAPPVQPANGCVVTLGERSESGGAA